MINIFRSDKYLRSYVRHTRRNACKSSCKIFLSNFKEDQNVINFNIIFQYQISAISEFHEHRRKDGAIVVSLLSVARVRNKGHSKKVIQMSAY
jgi:hypothetical protein